MSAFLSPTPPTAGLPADPSGLFPKGGSGHHEPLTPSLPFGKAPCRPLPPAPAGSPTFLPALFVAPAAAYTRCRPACAPVAPGGSRAVPGAPGPFWSDPNVSGAIPTLPCASGRFRSFPGVRVRSPRFREETRSLWWLPGRSGSHPRPGYVTRPFGKLSAASDGYGCVREGTERSGWLRARSASTGCVREASNAPGWRRTQAGGPRSSPVPTRGGPGRRSTSTSCSTQRRFRWLPRRSKRRSPAGRP